MKKNKKYWKEMCRREEADKNYYIHRSDLFEDSLGKAWYFMGLLIIFLIVSIIGNIYLVNL